MTDLRRELEHIAAIHVPARADAIRLGTIARQNDSATGRMISPGISPPAFLI
jgi:hypothetical protein